MTRPLVIAALAFGLVAIGALGIRPSLGANVPPPIVVPGLARDADSVGADTKVFDFEGGASPWVLDPGIWSVGPAAGSQSLVGDGHGFARLDAVGGPVSRMDFRFRLDEETSGIHASLFETFDGGHSRYFFSVQPTGVSLARQDGQVYNWLGEEPIQLMPGEVAQATILVGGGSIDLYIDGEAVLGADIAVPASAAAVSFESLDGTVAVDDVQIAFGTEPAPHAKAPRSPESYPIGADVGPFVRGAYVGDIVLGGNEALTLSAGRYTVIGGNIKMSGNAVLRIEEGAALIFDRGDSPLIHWGIDLTNNSALRLDGGSIVSAQGALVRVSAFGQTTVDIMRARPRIHFINAGGDSIVRVSDSRFVTTIGGSIQLSDRASVDISNSQVGAIALSVASGTAMTAHGLAPGHVVDFDLKRDLQTTGIGYGLTMKNVELVPDTLPEGPFERGWVIFADDGAALELGDSVVRKVVIEFRNSGPAVEVSGLRLDQPTDLTIGSVKLSAVTVTGQWGFFLHADRQATFNDCDALWFFLFDTARVHLKNSTMNEFDPRQYRGVMSFENSHWETAGEIIEGNDFVMEGTYEVDDETRRTLSWSTSTVTRRYPVLVRDAGGLPVPGAQVTAIQGGQSKMATTDASGTAILEFRFDDANRLGTWSVSAGGPAVAVDFFTTTPIVFTAP